MNRNVFEKLITEKAAVKYAVVLSPRTEIRHLSMKLIGIKQRNKVACGSMKFCFAVNPVVLERGIIRLLTTMQCWEISVM